MADDEQPDLSAFGGGSGAESGDSGEDSGPKAVDDSEQSADPVAVDEATEADVGAATEPDAEETAPVADLDRSERVELGVDLLAHVEAESLSLSEAVDRIETVTTNPALTREILDTAELRGVIDREDGRILTRRGGTFVRFERQVVRREGDYECRRCGAGLSTGHFVRFDSGELGPFGPSCVKKVLGRA